MKHTETLEPGVPSGAASTAAARAWFAIDRGVEKLCDLLLALAALSLFVMMAGMTAYVVSRKFGSPLPGAFYLSQELMVVLFALPLGAVTLRNGHIVFELVDKAFPRRLKLWFQLSGHVLGLIFFSTLSWHAVSLGLSSAAVGEYQQSGFDFPIWPFRIVLALALAVLSLAVLVAGVRAFRAARGLPPSAPGPGVR